MSDRTTLISNVEKVPIQITRIRVKAGTSLYEGRIILFYQVDFDSPKKKTKQLKTKDAGVLSSILVKEGDIVSPGAGLYSYKSGCLHSTVMNDLCAECGFDLQKDEKMSTEASVPMVHAIPSLKVSEEEARILGRADETRLIKDKKLVLLVDLDQTLIHTTNDNIDPNIKDIHHFQLSAGGVGSRYTPWYHTRLRPGTHQFLASISKWYELHICTFGSRNYAHQIARFLDQQGKYFSTRILSRDECFDAHSKTANLKALFPCGDNMVCIIDDREDVWNYALNLIHVKPYHFFRHTGDINAPPGLSKQDNDATQGYTCAQLAKGVSIKQSRSSRKHNKGQNKDARPSKERKRKLQEDDGERQENEENRRRGEEDRVTDQIITPSSTDLAEVATKKESNLSPSDERTIGLEDKTPSKEPKIELEEKTLSKELEIDFEHKTPSIQVVEEIKVLEEKISKTNREIVSIVKIVRSNSSDDKIPVFNVDDDSSNTPDCRREYVPSTTGDTDEIQYIPSTKSTNEQDRTSSVNRTNEQGKNEEYVPSISEDQEMKYVPSTDDHDEYVPTATVKSVQGIVYEPSSTRNEDKDVYVPTQTSPLEEYVPSSAAVIDTPRYTPTKTEELEYTPKPMDVEYVPPGIPDSIPYVPTSITEISPEGTGPNKPPAKSEGAESSVTGIADESKPRETAQAKEDSSESKIVNEEDEDIEESDNDIDDDDLDNGKDGNDDNDGQPNGDELKEVEEVDDYLLYLEEILKHIHEKFYATLDQRRERQEDGALPDLKSIIPAMRSVVLAGCHLVFSGVVPSKMRLEDNKAYSVATSLGATVSDQIRPATTHLVAVRSGTAKMNDAKRRKDIQIVTPEWLWMCAERWERVDERLFPVFATSSASSRTPPAHCASPPYHSSPPSPSPQFCDSINPLMTLTSEDLANMDKEVEDIFNESDDDEDDDLSNDSAKRKRANSSESSSVESLSGDRKGGWASVGQGVPESERKVRQARRRKKRKSGRVAQTQEEAEDHQDPGHALGNKINATATLDADDATSSDGSDSDESEEGEISDGETINSKFRRCAALPSDVEFDSSQDSATQDASGDMDEWGLMGAALERDL